MESQHKAKLKSIVLDLRHTLEGRYDDAGYWHPGDLEERLAALGVRRDREPLALEQLSHLSEEDQWARLVLDAFVQPALQLGRSREEAINEFLQETAYTWANRLMALRCMEARSLIDEIIIQKENYGGRSLKHHRLTRQKPEVCSGEDDGLYAALFSEFDERAKDLPLLFHPDEPVIALRPGVTALKKCIRLLSAADDIFTAPDALGWAYQYWNTEEKDRVFEKVRTIKGVKIEKQDIIPVTQLYTEPYMVKFLVQNSLGALWIAMHPESRIFETWEYYVRDADRIPAPQKPLRKISFLDPCVGSGHFLLEAFDLLYAMYGEEGELETPGEICDAILSQNLYGIDIDERAIQIAACALYMKAKEKDREFTPTRINLTATNIHPGADQDHLGAFLDKHPEDKPFESTLRLIFESLRHADELGTLLQIEEPVEKEFRFLKALDDEKKDRPPKQQPLFAQMEKPEQAQLPLGVLSYEEWKSGLLARLRAHFDEEFKSPDFFSRFFGETAGKGLSLFDFLSRRYDVVATNPPYMGSKNMGPIVKRYVEKHFTSGKRDLYAAFILRCLELSKPETGRVAMVTQQSWMFLRSFADLRALDEEKLKKAKGFTGILRETAIETLAHLGPGAFGEISGEVVNTALFTITKKTPNYDHYLIAFRLIGAKSPKEKDTLLCDAIGGRCTVTKFLTEQRSFLIIPQAPLSYWLRPRFIEILSKNRVSEIATVTRQVITSNNDRFLRYFWEVNRRSGQRWLGYLKPWGYGRWAGFENMVIEWSNGASLKAFIVEKFPYLNGNWGWLIKEETFFKPGWTYSRMARGCLQVRQIESGYVCDNSSPVIVMESSEFPMGVILNSRISSYFLRSLTTDMTPNESYIGRLPFPPKTDDVLKGIEDSLVGIRRCCLITDILECSFRNTAVGEELGKALEKKHFALEPLNTLIHTLEGWSERLVFDVYELSEGDMDALLAETGLPAGWFPLIKGYDTLPTIPNSAPHILSEVLVFLQTLERRNLSPDELIFQKQRLYQYYHAGPGVREDIHDTNCELSDDDDEESEQSAIGVRIPIPAETFLEELSQKLEIHPISVYWLLKEGIEQEGWRCLPEEQRLTKDRFTVLILHLLGHRWPKQIEEGEPVPDWADDDGIIPLMEGTDKPILHTLLRQRLAADCGDEQVSTEENAFEDIMGKPLADWVRKDFFRHHISQFKKRPIAWHVSSAKWTNRPRQEPAFECLAYSHKMDGDLLPKLKNQYVIPLIKRLEMELRTLESANGGLNGDQETRKSLLQDRIRELKSFEAVLTEVSASGFGPKALEPLLRQNAINDATLCLKAQWLKRLSSAIQEGPLSQWRQQADGTRLHPDFSTWIIDAVTHLDYHCVAVGPKTPLEKTLATDPTAKDLAAMICAESEAMVTDALKCTCIVWWKNFDAAILKPISEKIKDAKKELQTLKEEPLDSKTGFVALTDMKRKIDDVKADIKALQKEFALKSSQGKAVRDVMESFQCPEALAWETWLAEQPLYDQLSSLNARRPPPRTVAEFIIQESLYQPDINDGVRVNIAPLQKAGLLTADVLAGKDVDKAIADRAVWRDDERRWCREGKLPKPGWWE